MKDNAKKMLEETLTRADIEQKRLLAEIDKYKTDLNNEIIKKNEKE